MVKLGVNVDHIATLREARKELFPSPVDASKICIASGADSIVAHLREDRRHIKDIDIVEIRKAVNRFDMEMAATQEMLKIALKIKPNIVTLVPEKRQEVTTEGGLDVKKQLGYLTKYIKKLQSAGILVSLFVDPALEQIRASAKTGAAFVEIHTGELANINPKSLPRSDRGGALNPKQILITKSQNPKQSAYGGQNPKSKILKKIKDAVKEAKKLGLRVNAGHGLNLDNVRQIAKIQGVEELNIGFSIIADAVFIGLPDAVKRMKRAIAQ